MAGAGGFEPPTFGVKVRCATNCATRLFLNLVTAQLCLNRGYHAQGVYKRGGAAFVPCLPRPSGH